jgi:hypothetical protein
LDVLEPTTLDTLSPQLFGPSPAPSDAKRSECSGLWNDYDMIFDYLEWVIA